jgi:hypothetical protein
VRHDFVDVFGTAMVHLIVVRDRCYQVERLAVRSEEGRVLKASSLVLYLGDWDSSFSLERNRGNVGIYNTGFTGILLNGESEGMLVIELRIEPINGSHDQTFLYQTLQSRSFLLMVQFLIDIALHLTSSI